MIDSKKRPLHVAYDIARLSAGGVNGGIKVHHYEFLRHFVANHSDKLRLHVFCREGIVAELSFLVNKGHHQIHIIGERGSFEPRDSSPTLPLLRYWNTLPENLLNQLEIDVLYAGFGFSQLYTPEVPQVSLIVDVLHRSFPESLPSTEVKFRDQWYTEAIERSTLIQTNSEFCKQQLIDEFDASPSQVFTISLPLHKRFEHIETGRLPEQLVGLENQYFLYPANYWLHKNHACLLEGYARYKEKAGANGYHLVLTGQIEENGRKVAQRISQLGLSNSIHQIGHLDLPSFKAVWEQAHSLIFPSKYEGFGLPLLEALYFKKPVACSDSPYATKQLARFALKVSADSSSAWANAISELQHNPSKHRPAANNSENIDLFHEAQKLLESWQFVVSQSHKTDAKDAL